MREKPDEPDQVHFRLAREIQGQQKDDRDVSLRLERGYGRFHRRFILPESVDTEKIEANGRNGVLEIKIQKQAKAQPKRIKVA